MKKLIFIFLFLSINMFGCKTNYQETEATITDLKIEDGNFKVSIEYYVDDVRYTDEFDLTSARVINDSITTPHPGISFGILYDPSNPQKNKIDFNVKAKYSETK